MSQSIIGEVDVARHGLGDLADRLRSGEIILLRNADAIRQFRQRLIDAVRTITTESVSDLEAFYGEGRLPGIETLTALTAVVRQIRRDRVLSACLAPLIASFGLAPPVRLDGGISRVVLPPDAVMAARQSGRLPDIAFKRVSADGEVEVFMPGPANIHRDYNRQHHLFQVNLWFPLHDAGEDEVLRLYPQYYREPVFDMDATPENFSGLGEPLRYRLAFGDAVLFHGEHLHTSPPPGLGQGRRHSYDFRIAAQCGDDTAHYRAHFLDIRNFVPESAEQAGALRALRAIEQEGEIGRDQCARSLELFNRAPFVEDRYLILARRAVQVDKALGAQAYRRVVERSPLWFWILKASEGLLDLGETSAARDGLHKARKLAGAAATMPDTMPVRYAQPPTQPMPDEAVRRCNTLLDAISAQAETSNDSSAP